MKPIHRLLAIVVLVGRVRSVASVNFVNVNSLIDYNSVTTWLSNYVRAFRCENLPLPEMVSVVCEEPVLSTNQTHPGLFIYADSITRVGRTIGDAMGAEGLFGWGIFGLGRSGEEVGKEEGDGRARQLRKRSDEER